ncbi:glycosyltransferase [Candidatus Gracilibacteria bacterium]|nr:glycosyltransferase [Candidatus Gracilibacteria bacterium]
MQQPRLRVCYFGTYRANYARNTIIIEGLRQVGVEVVECHETLWQSFEDRERTASGGWLRPSFWLRVLSTYLRLLLRYVRMPKNFDVMVVGYPGQFDIFLARLLSWWQRKPLVWDVLMSIYLICVERGLDRRSPLTVRIIRFAERLACHTPDMLILDTQTYVDWFCKIYDVDPARFRRVPLCADERTFPAVAAWQPSAPAERFRVLYYGTYIPNHGVPYIVEAARLLGDLPAIEFEFIGGGPQRELAVHLAERYELANVRFYGWLDKAELGAHIAQADLCLGTFGDTPQSLMTVQNKIYEAMAMGRPVLTGASPAVRESLIPGEHLLSVVTPTQQLSRQRSGASMPTRTAARRSLRKGNATTSATTAYAQ